jgi:hypothetical protein
VQLRLLAGFVVAALGGWIVQHLDTTRYSLTCRTQPGEYSTMQMLIDKVLETSVFRCSCLLASVVLFLLHAQGFVQHLPLSCTEVMQHLDTATAC